LSKGPSQYMEFTPAIRRLTISLAVLLVLSLVGFFGFLLIDDHSPVEAFFMTIITMSTVGFGTVRDLSPAGMIFASFLIIGSAGTFIYAITNLTTFLVEGEIRDAFHQYRVRKHVRKLKNHVIICGLGRNGLEAAEELFRQNQSFVVIDQDENVIREFLEAHPNALIIMGDATSDEILGRANIQDARGLITSLSTDAENVFITLTARELNPRIKVIARASSESTITKLKRAGANEVILPNLIGGRKMVNLITRPALVEFVEMVSGQSGLDFHLEVISCANHDQLIGKTIAELNVRSRTGATIIGLKHGDERVQLSPPAHLKLTEEDRLFLLGKDSQLEAFQEIFLS
jgi:voltage-gated potassium channel